MKSALLIGNGPNRCYEDRQSPIAWSNLLKDFAQQKNVEFHENNSFPLEFECMVNAVCAQKPELSSIDVVNDAKETIVRTVKSLNVVDDPVHCRFLELDIDEILTTNYDYYLEQAYVPGVKVTPGREDKFSLSRCFEINGKRFRHIHGEADKPKTICLGYEHYAGTLQHMRAYIKKLHLEEAFSPSPNAEIPQLPGNIWLDLMFTHNVHIVGLRLEMCEIDLWWLLTYRAYLYHMSQASRAFINNTITFYDTTPRSDSEIAYQRSLFERLHVNYVYVDALGRFKEAYEEVAEMIRDQLSRS